MKATTNQILEGEWSLIVSDPDEWSTPADIPAAAIMKPARVPGTVAGALMAAGEFDPVQPHHLAGHDYWYVMALTEQPIGPATLVFDGLATIAEVYLGETLILGSESMYLRHEVAVTLTGQDILSICFRALDPHLDKSGPRARWRPQMITPQGLRLFRTTLLGHMPGWCPEIDAIGPWRPIHIRHDADFTIDDLSIDGSLDAQGRPVLNVSFQFSGKATDLQISCAGWTGPVLISEGGRLTAKAHIADAQPWWPNGYGEPALYDITLIVNGTQHRIGRTGFRTIDLDTGADGRSFGLIVNGVPIFCRGAVWTNADIATLPGDRDSYKRFLTLAADAHMNMIRIGGTMAYETAEFFALCDELGLLVWQDAMLANFDYPAADDAFVASLRAEISQLLTATTGSPSLAVFCGGSEMAQQASMLGLPERFWSSPLTAEIIPDVVHKIRPDLIYVPNSPFGGAMPFSPDTSVTHYYGVGAYCRPLEDARRATIRFAAECLAFAHVPEQATLDDHLPVPAVHDPKWKARVPRDRGVSWDFEDIRDHYLKTLYGFDPAELRREDPLKYLELSRAISGDVSEQTFAEWRRPGSTTRGALVWTLQDLLPGTGWGLIDSTGRPKPVWHYLRRAFRPIQIILTDEGTNGLDVHLLNDSAETIEVILTLNAIKAGRRKVVGGNHPLVLAGQSATTFAATSLFGAFFDTTYAYRFGPPSHDVTHGRIVHAETGALIAEAFHYPRGRMVALHAGLMTASLDRDETGWLVTLSSDCLVQGVHFAFDGYQTDDNWFDLAPDLPRIIRLAPDTHGTDGRIDPDARPVGELRHLGAPDVIRL